VSESTRFIAAVVIAVFRGGRVLAMRRAPDKDAGAGAWEALSGRVLPGEDPLQAALREAREECGLEPAIEPRPIASYQAKRNRDDMIVVVYRGAAETGDVVLSSEHDRFAWMDLDEFTRACPFPQLVEAVRLAGAQSAIGRPRLEIVYCTQCRWLLRAAWMAQEILTTFEAEIGAVALRPGTGGVFDVRLGDATIWSRQTQGRFPDLKELKQIVRDRIAPDKDLGHSERTS
jgi:selenoprotein W-related protein